jgi:hypothetical protein
LRHIDVSYRFRGPNGLSLIVKCIVEPSNILEMETVLVDPHSLAGALSSELFSEGPGRACRLRTEQL